MLERLGVRGSRARGRVRWGDSEGISGNGGEGWGHKSLPSLIDRLLLAVQQAPLHPFLASFFSDLTLPLQFPPLLASKP